MLGLAGDFDHRMTADADRLNQVSVQNTDTQPIAPQPESDGTEALAPSAAKGWVATAAIIAGLILGVVLASSFGIGSDFRAGEGLLFAQGTLAQNLASNISGKGGVGPSFWSKDGSFCRVFSIQSVRASGMSGIACRESGGWRVRIVTATSGAGDIRASGKSTMQNLIVGAPLDAAAEQQARRQGWRPG
jgi:hypothetical protein